EGASEGLRRDFGGARKGLGGAAKANAGPKSRKAALRRPFPSPPPSPARGEGELVYHSTSAMEQFRPEPMPSRATRLPFFRRPISLSLLSTIGTEAGPRSEERRVGKAWRA